MLDLPSAAPKRFDQKLLIAWIATRCRENQVAGLQAEAEVASRYVQQMLLRSGGGKATAFMRQIRDQGWIQVATRHTARTGATYVLGPLAVANERRWQALGDRLFGPTGLMTPYLGRPCIKVGMLNTEGVLLLGLVGEAGPISQADLFKLVRGWIPHSTFSNRVKLLRTYELADCEGKEFRLPADLESCLSEYEEITGAKAEADLLRRGIQAEQEEFNAAHRTEYGIKVRKAELRQEPCMYCLAFGSTGDEVMQVDHYPPQHWGGSDTYSLLFPSCRTHNHRYGQAIVRTAPLPRPTQEGSAVHWVGGDTGDVERVHWQLHANHAEFVEAMERGDQDLAVHRERVANLFPIWTHLLGAGQGVNAVDVDGEVTPLAGSGRLRFDGSQRSWWTELLAALDPTPPDDR